MNKDQLIEVISRSVSDERVLAAMAAVPRDEFVPASQRSRAWENEPLPIARGQTISQPTVVAKMCERLRLDGDETVLDVGTGSGYHAAVLSRLARSVVSVERHAELVDGARANLRAVGIENVELVVGDGWKGHEEGAPYDAINVAAAIGEVPAALTGQLADRGRMVLPLGSREQKLVLIERAGDRFLSEEFEWVRFVPLIRDP